MKRAQFLVITFLLGLTAYCSHHSAQKPEQGSGKDRSAYRPSTREYQVQKGDTLLLISIRVGIDYQRLAEWNQLVPPFVIKEGQVLSLRPNVTQKAAQNTVIPARPKTESVKVPVASVKPMLPDWVWPVKGKRVRVFQEDENSGVDLSVTQGQSVVSSADGKVVYIGDSIIGYGNLIIIRHDDIYMTAYSNNREVLVKNGDEVKKGQVIARAGSELKPVLHFEIRKQGEAVNPDLYLPPM